MADINDSLLQDLQTLFEKHKIEHAFLAVPQVDAECYILLPYQMGPNAIRHMAASLLQNIQSAAPPVLN